MKKGVTQNVVSNITTNNVNNTQDLSICNNNQITIASYNRESENWNRTRQEFWGEIANEIKKYILLDNKKNIKILDAGCGNGRLLNFLSAYKNDINFEYLGFDPSQELIKYAQHNFESFKNNFIVKNLLSTEFDIKDISKEYLNDNVLCDNVNFDNYKADIVLSIAVFHHFNLSEFEIALKNLRSVKHSTSPLILTLWKRVKAENKQEMVDLFNKDSKRYVYNYNIDELREIFIKNNCEIVEIKEIERNKKNGLSNIFCVIK